MDGSAHISETRQGKLLARLAMFSERMVEMSVERAEAAETAEEFKVYSDAVAKHARSARMILALENRLMRDTEAHEAAHREHRQRVAQDAKAHRRQRLYDELAGEIRHAFHEDTDFIDEVLSDLHETLAREMALETFLEEPLAIQIARLKTLFQVDGRDYGVAFPEGSDADPEDDDSS